MEYAKGFKFRIYPNAEQQKIINQTLGCARFVYNHFLAIRRDSWQEKHESVTYVKSSRMLTELKCHPDFVWLKSVDSMALQEALRNLDRAFQNFFKKQSGYPKFKSKHSHNQYYRTRNQSGGIRIIDGNIKLPRIGIVKTKLSREFEGRILNATVSRTASGKYFVSLCVEMYIELLLGRNNSRQIGIDVGIKDFYSNDQGNTVANPRILKGMEKKLKYLQRSLSRKAKGSNNRNKARIKVARLQERIANIRKDFLHKESTKLVRENQLIAVENLKIKNMLRNHKLAKAISDVSWAEFFRMLEYKAKLYGCDVVKVDTFYPSSQTCSCCGYQNKATKNLGIRKWTCPQCNTYHDRDVNAARNILRKALEMQKSA